MKSERFQALMSKEVADACGQSCLFAEHYFANRLDAMAWEHDIIVAVDNDGELIAFGKMHGFTLLTAQGHPGEFPWLVQSELENSDNVVGKEVTTVVLFVCVYKNSESLLECRIYRQTPFEMNLHLDSLEARLNAEERDQRLLFAMSMGYLNPEDLLMTSSDSQLVNPVVGIDTEEEGQ